LGRQIRRNGKLTLRHARAQGLIVKPVTPETNAQVDGKLQQDGSSNP